jgi:RNA polymerase sigma-B factor
MPEVVTLAELYSAKHDEQVRTLFRELRQGRNQKLREELVEMHSELVVSWVRRLAGTSEAQEDLTQVGTIGLIIAVDSYNPQRKSKFTTYANTGIRRELIHHFRDNTRWFSGISRPLLIFSRGLTMFQEEWFLRHGVEATIADLATETETSSEVITEALLLQERFSPTSMVVPCQDSDEMVELEDLVGQDDPAFSRADISQILDLAYAKLAPGDRKAVLDRYINGRELKEIADERKMNPKSLSCRIARALKVLKRHLPDVVIS